MNMIDWLLLLAVGLLLFLAVRTIVRARRQGKCSCGCDKSCSCGMVCGSGAPCGMESSCGARATERES